MKVKHGEMGIFRRTERSMVYVYFDNKHVYVVFNETIDQLAMANSVRWHGHVLKRVDSQVFRRAFEVECQGKKGRPKKTWK